MPFEVGSLANKRRVSIAASFAIALIMLAPGITSPFQKDAEPQSAQWIVDIVQRGDWLLPRDYYNFIERKPPLFYWLSALATKVSGGRVDEARARVVSLVAGAALAAGVMAWAASTLGNTQGWLAFFFLIGMSGFASRATTALTDMLMTFLMLSAYCTAWPMIHGDASRRRTACVGGLLALAILSKGPVAIALPALAILIYFLLIRSNPSPLLTRGWIWTAIALAVATASLWYVPAFLVGRREGFERIFIDENLGHFMPASMGGTGEAARPVYYIAMRMIGGALPLTLLLPAFALALAFGQFGASRRPVLYQLAMVAAVLLLFSTASAKRDDYILPALPSLAILLAALFAEQLDTASRRLRYAIAIRDIAALTIAVAMLAVTVGGLVHFHWGARFLSIDGHLNSSDTAYINVYIQGLATLAPPFAAFAAAVVVGVFITFAGVWRSSGPITGTGVGILCVAGSILWTAALRPMVAARRNLAQFAKAIHLQAGAVPVYAAYDNQELAWYYGEGVPALPESIARSGPKREIYIVARERELYRLAPAVRRNLKPVIRPTMLDGGGPPTLYHLGPLRKN